MPHAAWSVGPNANYGLTAHPEAWVLSQDTGFERDYGRNPYAGYGDMEVVR